MRERFVDRCCSELPGTQSDRPFGPDTVVWKVDGRMFVAYTVDGEGVSLRVTGSFTASTLVEEGRAWAREDLLRGGWVILPWETPPEELGARIRQSHALVRRRVTP